MLQAWNETDVTTRAEDSNHCSNYSTAEQSKADSWRFLQLSGADSPHC